MRAAVAGALGESDLGGGHPFGPAGAWGQWPGTRDHHDTSQLWVSLVAPVEECPPKSMVESVSLAALPRVPPEVSGLGQTGDEMTSAALAQEPEARFDHGSRDEIRWGVLGRGES